MTTGATFSGKKERGDIWLAVSGLVEQDGKVLVVKKAYGATEGLWTLPSGFVKADETVDEAAVREVFEETAITAVPVGLVAVRSGVLRQGKHDTLLVFRLRYASGVVTPCARELQTAAWMSPAALAVDPSCTEFLAKLCQEALTRPGLTEHPIVHTHDYGYSSYKIFY